MKLKLLKFNPVYWSLLIFVVSQVILFAVIIRENPFLESHNINFPRPPSGSISVWPGTVTTTSTATSVVTSTTPVSTGILTVTQTIVTKIIGETSVSGYSSLGPILIYFFSVVIILGLILFIVPLKVLSIILKILFVVLFCWGMFISLVFFIPIVATLVIAVVVGVVWFFFPRVWLHNAVLVLALVSVGAVFGRLISPWTAMIVLAALAIYDFLAVRFGYMVWMAKRMSESTTLPAIVIPYSKSNWNSSLKTTDFVVEEKPSDRKYSILGGGDIGFSLLIIASVYFASGLIPGIVMAVFTLLGLIAAYWIQAVFLKGKPMPALPPIAVLSLIGLLVVNFIV